MSNAGPSTLTGSINDVIPAQLTATGVSSAVNGSASTANFSLTGTTFAGSVTIASGGTVTVTIQVTGAQRQLHQHPDRAGAGGHDQHRQHDGHGPGHGEQRGQHHPEQDGGLHHDRRGRTTSFTLVVSNAGPQR